MFAYCPFASLFLSVSLQTVKHSIRIKFFHENGFFGFQLLEKELAKPCPKSILYKPIRVGWELGQVSWIYSQKLCQMPDHGRAVDLMSAEKELQYLSTV